MQEILPTKPKTLQNERKLPPRMQPHWHELRIEKQILPIRNFLKPQANSGR